MSSIKEITPWELIICFFGDSPEFETESIPEYPDLELLKSDLNPADLHVFEDLREEKNLVGILRFTITACNSAEDKQCKKRKRCYVLDSVLRENNPFAYLDAPSIFMNLYAYLEDQEENPNTIVNYILITNTPYHLDNPVIEPGQLSDSKTFWNIVKTGFNRAMVDLYQETSYLSDETLLFTRCYLQELLNCNEDFLERFIGTNHEKITQLNGSLKVMEEEQSVE